MTVYRLANLAFQLGGDYDLLRNLADGSDNARADEPADVLLLVEARDRNNQPLPVADILGRDWDASQDTTSGALGGSVIATRRRHARSRWSLLRVLSRAGRKVQTRYQRVGAIHSKRGKVGRVAVVHLALRSTGRQDDGVAEVRAWVQKQRRKGKRWMVAGDANMDPEQMARILDAPNFYGKDVVGFWWSEGWGDVDTYASTYRGSDHAVLTLTTRD